MDLKETQSATVMFSQEFALVHLLPDTEPT